eukprot:TRINITY_DN8959_c0_g1_i1.p1 TRINITY_DN8959_c0_g1~~TRINITY_DN8959_c0_g1_i1.p1  ORF type:complete len:441 (-),score=99.46 TRINITY_DN8959_c0_g1_i1:86-1408(-)
MASLSCVRASQLVSLLMIGAIAFSYTFWLIDHRQPAFLPTISNTWDYAPGNYVSRWAVSVCCCMMQLLAVTVYFATKEKFSGCRFKAGLLLAMASVGIFCLSWVGAICDNAKLPSCRGDNNIHSPCAVIFFVLYDMYLIVSIKQEHSTGHAMALAVPCLLTKLRWILPVIGAAHSQTLLACFEWTDVALIMIFQVRYTRSVVPTYAFSIAELQPKQQTTTVVAGISANKLVGTAIALSLFSTLVPWAFALHQGVVQPHQLPVISDTWWHAPGNWISRWAVNLGCNFMHLVVVCIGIMSAKATAHLKLAQIAVFGLSVVGCVSEKENDTLHLIAAATWCAGFDCFMVWTSFNSKSDMRSMQLGATVVAVLSSLRFTSVQLALGQQRPMGQSVFALYEWSDLLAVYVFFIATVVFDGEARGSKIGLVITSEAGEDSEMEVQA